MGEGGERKGEKKTREEGEEETMLWDLEQYPNLISALLCVLIA